MSNQSTPPPKPLKPLEATATLSTNVQVPATIQHIEHHGLLLRLNKPSLRVGEKLTLTFALPTAEEQITEEGKIIKIFVSFEGKKPVYTVEFHFKSPQKKTITAIEDLLYLASIEKKSGKKPETKTIVNEAAKKGSDDSDKEQKKSKK